MMRTKDKGNVKKTQNIGKLRIMEGNVILRKQVIERDVERS